MLIYLIIIAAGMLPGQAEFNAQQLNIQVSITSNVYIYRVTNLNTSPIISFEIKQHAAYNFKAPDNWQIETPPGMLHAWTVEPEAAILPGTTAEFSYRISSSGASLGQAEAIVKFQSGETASVSDVWTAVSEPRSHIALVGVLILFILLIHTAIVFFRS
ncbi:MAG: hypothetical protein ACYSSL_09155, partial [Planctomycetota bacterium]